MPDPGEDWEYVCRDCEEVLQADEIDHHRGIHDGPITRLIRRDLYEEQHGPIESEEAADV